MQALEGEQETISELFDSICTDDRHTCVHLRWKESISTRTVLNWSMGFRELREGETATLRGYTRFFDEDFQNTALDKKKA